MKIDEKFLKPYDPISTESQIYKKWEASGLFNPDECIKQGFTKPDAEPFSIVLPPPNVTGQLHTGHALMLAIEDTIVRFYRMKGHRTLWIPGTDHAAIATQSKVEKILQKEEGLRRHDLGREKFLEKVHQYAKKSHSTITNQMKSMGASVDWTREAFTLDETREHAVKTAFKKMYDDGLIYRGNRIVNWDPKGQTTVSDEEVIHEPSKAKMYYFKYSHDFPITIATTRPETKVGDTAVAVNPDDDRYKDLVGKTFEVKFCGVPLSVKIIADKEVDPEFGTGALGVTPAHSMIDFEMSQKHDLPVKQVINEFAKMEIANEDVSEKSEEEILNGKKTLVAREIIVGWLRRENLLEKEEEIEQNLSKAERTGGVIEPLPKLQWFIDVNKKIKTGFLKKQSLKEMMTEAVKSGETEILPERFERIYYNWIENLRDWCISRQIWYGHQIPVWYKNAGQENEEIYVGLEAPKGEGWEQDSDTLDTWFSSGLWTFSTLGWPEQTEDLKNYHPTNLLETGFDIIFFWVARMILMSKYLLKEVPFKTVYLHGIVRDKQGRKISKSLDNGVDPIELNEKYGADAQRMAMLVGVGPGNDLNLGEDKIRAYKKFSNKIWNASRFVLENLDDDFIKKIDQIKISDKYQKYFDDFQKFTNEITDDLLNYRLYLASEKIYHYFWHTFADKIIEESKKDPSLETQKMLYLLLKNSLKILHPFMPFVTESIWQSLPKENESEMLIVAKWPEKI